MTGSSDESNSLRLTRMQHLHILHLEDNSDDRHLVSLALRKQGLDCAITVARSREEFEERLLRDEALDLILSDSRIPGYAWRAALLKATELHSGVPFVFVSGELDKRVKAEALKAGAVDFVSKDELDGLGTVIVGAVLNAVNHKQV